MWFTHSFLHREWTCYKFHVPFLQSSEDLLTNNDATGSTPGTKKAQKIQPSLVCNMNGSERRGKFFIKADGQLIPVGSNGLRAFDILLKLHYCFGVKFAPDLVNFYDFITGCIMKLNTPKSCSIALSATLNNVALSNEKGDDTTIHRYAFFTLVKLKKIRYTNVKKKISVTATATAPSDR